MRQHENRYNVALSGKYVHQNNARLRLFLRQIKSVYQTHVHLVRCLY